MHSEKPIVMCFSGLDTTGGAGLQADIETLFSLGCHCAPVATALTVQNTQHVISSEPTDATLIVQQARAVLEDMNIKCFKLGVVGSIEAVEVIHTVLNDYPGIPVIIDPVLSAGGGFSFGESNLIDAIRSLLLPLCTVLTPNVDEIARLSPTADSHDACANEIMELGCQHVLLTGTHSATPDVVNCFYAEHMDVITFNWPRLENTYHGSGCTLAAAVAGYIAHGLPMHDAIQQAQRFTWEALQHGTRMGMGQLIPNRSYWNIEGLE